MKQKSGISIFLAVCLLFSVLLAGCGAKDDNPGTSASDSGSGAVSGDVSSSSPESENPPEEVSNSHNPHAPVMSSSFDVNGVHFWNPDDEEMECLIFEKIEDEGVQVAKITLGGATLNIQVTDRESQSDWYDVIVSQGVRVQSNSGDLGYAMQSGDRTEIAMDSGKIILLSGGRDGGSDWKSVGNKLEWTVIGGSEPAPDTTQPADVGGTEKVINLTGDGVEYGTVTLSGFLDDDSAKFEFSDGKTYNWRYSNVAAGGVCTITPSDICKYTVIYLEAYTLKDGIYSYSDDMDAPFHKLYADGEAEDIALWGEMSQMPLATSEHPAYFTFGENLKSFVLKADGTMYCLTIEFYDESEIYVGSYTLPLFVK